MSRRVAVCYWLSVVLAYGTLAYGQAVGNNVSEAEVPLETLKSIPAWQVIPLPYDMASIQCDGQEVTRYHFGTALRRPFLFPIIGPSGQMLTRMGHPHDPEGHSHHNSVWISHNDVNGVSFWSDREAGQIVHRRIVSYEDETDHATVVAESEWMADDKPLLRETRRIEVRAMPDRQRLILIDLQLVPASNEPVTFGDTPFGLIGVRMAKSIGVHDGGGMIRNSEGNQGETGANGCFRKPARWCDYAGRSGPGSTEGITLLDHRDNVNHPAAFHVRADGWMGACLTHQRPISVTADAPLVLRYGLYVHTGIPELEALSSVWQEFCDLPVVPFP